MTLAKKINGNPFSAYSTPHTREDWQIAADLAQLLLELETARRYGLITPRGRVNEDLCNEFLKRARQLTIEPRAFWKR